MSEPLPVDIRFQWRATNFAINDPEKCTQYIGPEMTDINMEKKPQEWISFIYKANLHTFSQSFSCSGNL